MMLFHYCVEQHIIPHNTALRDSLDITDKCLNLCFFVKL